MRGRTHARAPAQKGYLIMAISITSPSAKLGFIKNATSANASDCEEIHAAVAGKKIKVRHLTINSDANITVTIGQGETAGAVTTALIGPITFAGNDSMQWDFNPFLELATNTALTVDSSGAGNICVFVQGFVQ